MEKQVSDTLYKVIIIYQTSIPAEENKPIGIWGQRHLRYQKEYRRITDLNLLTSGKLNAYIVDIDRQTEDLFLRLVKQMTEHEGVTEQFKGTDQMEWGVRMNNIRSRAIEIINHNIIHT